MKDQAEPVRAMAELPEATREFLARLRPEDLQTLENGLRLINSVLTVGKFVKWLVVGILGLVVGVQMFWDSVVKLYGWVRG
ncbi:hypothetical protein [Shinella pollutisoli]|uniref:Uncharacterized protein n=1 Tax=Shinella pollutisoli TaxID=2250594 RepID=A0ABV7DIG1_9HYPH|nr:hypothetical protein [Shinella pollutisoli]